MTSRLRRVGERGILVDCASGETARLLIDSLRERPLPGQRDLVAGARTVFVRFAGTVPRGKLLARVDDLSSASHGGDAPRRRLTLDVVYDGEDLDAVAGMLGTSREGVVARHAGTAWRAAFAGFLPGFFYLASESGALDVPRRSEPRVRVPSGSVALAGGYSGVYPSASPGGWQLLGRTDAPLWDASRDVPSLIEAGDAVTFRPVRALATAAPPPTAPRPASPAAPPHAVVLSPGILSLVQDAGRPEAARWGVPPSGAADRVSFRAANALVGNRADAAGLEIIAPGFLLRAERPIVLAVAGAPAPAWLYGPSRDESVPHGAPFLLKAGEELELGAPEAGLRSYLAFRGGLRAERLFGSSSRDTLSLLGPPPLAAGSPLHVDPSPRTAVGSGAGLAPLDVERPYALVRGPRDDWFDGASFTYLLTQEWRLSADSDRVGVRLRGETPLRTTNDGQLPSEAVVRGSIQVPPSGQPIVFLADHPVTGGYPVIATLREGEASRLAQARPGDVIRFCEG